MLPEKPDVEKYIQMVDDLARIKDELATKEYEYEKFLAFCIRTAMKSGAKTRELDFIKVLGNSQEDTDKIDKMRKEIQEYKKSVTLLYGKIEAWKSSKELYRSDSYNQVGGFGMHKLDNKEEQ